MRRTLKNIIDLMPYGKGFKFIDSIIEVDENHISGEYHFSKNQSFYHSHFPGNPVTPGVILMECMGQIGLIAHGYYLLGDSIESHNILPSFVHSDIEFLNPVFPGTTVRVESEKVFFKNNHLRSKINMFNVATSEIVARSNSMVKFFINNSNDE